MAVVVVRVAFVVGEGGGYRSCRPIRPPRECCFDLWRAPWYCHRARATPWRMWLYVYVCMYVCMYVCVQRSVRVCWVPYRRANIVVTHPLGAPLQGTMVRAPTHIDIQRPRGDGHEFAHLRRVRRGNH